ncbi:MAG: cytoplasmic protein [Bacteroidota bacterium]|nr:cytoplasmic protein [Bacteroidota bacterium]
MDLIPIRVESYAGYKADESPRFFYWDNIRFEIKEIADRWYQGYIDSEELAANYFKVITTDDKFYLLKHELESDQWYLLIKGEMMNVLP